jgi:hypothetical protein
MHMHTKHLAEVGLEAMGSCGADRARPHFMNIAHTRVCVCIKYLAEVSLKAMEVVVNIMVGRAVWKQVVDGVDGEAVVTMI